MLGPCSLGMTMSNLYFLYLARPYPWNVDNVYFTFLLCVIALCMMFLYLYMLVCRWLCTLYNGLLWLSERPSLVTSALDLVVLVCAQDNYCRYIFTLYCVRDHCSVIISIHVTWVTLVFLCMQHASICLMLWGASACPSISMLARTTYIGTKPYRCAIVHLRWSTTGFLPWK